MQAIVVKYRGPTNTTGSRWVVSCNAGCIIVPRDFAVDALVDARFAANLFVKKMGWEKHGTLIEAGLPNGNRVFVFAPIEAKALAAVKRATPWLGKMIADKAHLNSVAPNDCVGAMHQCEDVLEHARRLGMLV